MQLYAVRCACCALAVWIKQVPGFGGLLLQVLVDGLVLAET